MSGEKLGSHSKLWEVTEHYRVRGGNRVPDPKRRSRTAKHNQADSGPAAEAPSLRRIHAQRVHKLHSVPVTFKLFTDAPSLELTEPFSSSLPDSASTSSFLPQMLNKVLTGMGVFQAALILITLMRLPVFVTDMLNATPDFTEFPSNCWKLCT